MNPYNLVEVRFKKVVVHARPVEFVLDEAGQPVKALKLVTTCPGCGALNEIDVSNITIVEGIVLDSACASCSAPDAPVLKVPKPVEKVVEKQPAVLIKQDLLKNDVKREAGILGRELVDVNDEGFIANGAFVDPIALGTFEIEDI